MRRLVFVITAALWLPACGTERPPTPNPLAVKEPKGLIRATEPRTGLSIEVPGNWRRDFRSPPGMFRIASGAAQVSGWAYRRSEPLPAGDEDLEAAKDALVEESKRRNATLRVESTRISTVAGAPAVELVGVQTVEGQVMRTRSVHFYRGGTEYVVEALAPPRAFAKADHGVLRPLLASLRFGEAEG